MTGFLKTNYNVTEHMCMVIKNAEPACNKDFIMLKRGKPEGMISGFPLFIKLTFGGERYG